MQPLDSNTAQGTHQPMGVVNYTPSMDLITMLTSGNLAAWLTVIGIFVVSASTMFLLAGRR